MPRVMLIEDDPTMLSLLKILLDMEGYEILSLEDDSQAGILAAVIASRPDLILMDVNLRKANGLDVLRSLRQQEGSQQVRIVMSSGMDYRVECMQGGADYFLPKPFMPDELVAVMRRVLGQVT